MSASQPNSAKVPPFAAILPLVFILFLLGCRQAEAVPGAEGATTRTATGTHTPRPTATATTTPTTTATPTSPATQTPSPTPTITPTPTPTAVPLLVMEDPRAQRLARPADQGGPRCGLVDILDFPIDPPDAATVASGGRDFGVFRQRYDKYHAGEDWGGPRGGSNFGTPVYAIGHGLVTYAEPEGWNRDKGVVIVQHTFDDGRSLLSFYGHLDPPSVTLTPGDCIVRGETVGNIGRPRSSPHLHFEIRSHLRYQPGPGYWPEDPAMAGWEPPSETIWQNRMAGSPGILWVRPPLLEDSRPVGLLKERLFLMIQDARLAGIDLNDGRTLWQYPVDDEADVAAAWLAPDNSRLLLANRLGVVQAYAIAGTEDDTFRPDRDLSLLWEIDLPGSGSPTIIPLAEERAAVALQETLFGLGPDGQRLWQADLGARPLDWATAGAGVVLATAGPNSNLWHIDQAGAAPFPQRITGFLAAGEQPFLYANEGIYRLDLEEHTARLIQSLPAAVLLQDMVSLPDGGVLVAHTDSSDRRLLAFDAAGQLRWDRSFAQVPPGALQLFTSGNQVLLISEVRQQAGREYPVYRVDLEQATLTHIFTGGTRSGQPAVTWPADPGGGGLLLNIGGGHLLLLDPQTAYSAVSAPPAAN